ncbi:peptidase C14 [Embleya scabrispora]|uniref:Peptidase C14 n=2 Tax=Embleya scabrispora TaxID=159449 RepID=A0A1T3P4D2_9ACTN|nr:peptidase C14 [Embleya scabrispora]
MSSLGSSPSSSRRRLLAAGGLGGLLLAGSAAAGTASAAPDDDRVGGAREVSTSVPNVAALLRLDPRRTPTDGVVLVAGYHAAGDGGAMVVRWDPRSRLPVNGGTVLADPSPRRDGRWIQVHDGVMDFRRFGILDDKVPADAALDAMVNDPYIHRVEAHSDLLFVKRHTFARSRIVLDFGGHTVRTTGIEKNTHDNPFGAVLYFRGKVTGAVVTYALPETVIELTDVFPVPDAGAFKVGEWWTVEIDPIAGGGTYERELQKLVEITQVVDGRHIRVDYLNGWELAAGRGITWTRVEPVQRADVRNMVFFGAGAADDEYTGSHPIAYEYAVRCDVTGIEATGSFWPVVMRRWCTHFVTARSSLKNPPTVMYGGAGYLTQQIYCLYGRVEDCVSSNARHLNDLTASAYCHVVNCHGDGDDQGGNPFTTHGQYEHDLLFEGNSGLMDIANSGVLWGTSAKRITVRDHTCSWFVAGTKITDLTLENVRVIPRPTFDPGGTLQVNADGVQMRGCAARTFAIGQRSNRSTRPNIVEGCTFDLPAKQVLVQTPVSNTVHFRDCLFTGVDGAILRGSGEVDFDSCTLVGAGPAAAPLEAGSAVLRLTASTLTDTGILLSAVRDQSLHASAGTRLTGGNGAGALLSRGAGAGVLRWHLAGAALATDGAHVRLAGGVNHWMAGQTRFTGGRLELRPEAFGGASSALHTGCVEDGVTRSAMPADGPRVVTSGNLAI